MFNLNQNCKINTMPDCKEKLFDQFPPVSTEEWMEKVTADLKGADFNKKLVWRTNEGFNVKPMYRAEYCGYKNHKFFTRRISLCSRD